MTGIVSQQYQYQPYKCQVADLSDAVLNTGNLHFKLITSHQVFFFSIASIVPGLPKCTGI